ncbi:MAG TPA: hypothetical protein VNR18_12165 [Hyphomicrobiales bacterium]|nr:hypothetical protein [Hyphomicrobiales bacterium]
MLIPTGYRRRVSLLERYSLALQEAHHYQLNAVVEGNGYLDADRLQAAVTAASAANPGTRVRLIGWLGFSYWVDSGVAPRVRDLGDVPWEGRSAEAFAPLLLERLDPLRGGAVADVLLLRAAGGQRSCLVFRAHHGAFDGRGLMYWMRDVFRALRGEALLGSDSTLRPEDVQRQYRDQVAAFATATRPQGSIVPVLPPATPQGGAAVDLHHTWRCLVIPRKVPQVMLQSALFFAAWARRQDSGRVVFTVPVDYRGLRTQARSTGNLIGYLQLEVDADATQRSLTRQLTGALRAHADCRELTALRKIVWRPVQGLAPAVRRRLEAGLYSPASPTGGLVSLGPACWEEITCPGFQPDFTYSIPPFVGRLNAIFVELPDRTVATISVPLACARNGELDALAAAYLAHFSQG